jgi:hypothetical protein
MAAITGNDPAIRPMQTWVLRSDDGRLMKKLRILAMHPEPYRGNSDGTAKSSAQWIYKEEPIAGRQIIETVLSWIPEYNLRRLFVLDYDPVEQTESDLTLSLPHVVMIEVGPEQPASITTIKTVADVDRVVRDIHGCLDALEEIAQFDQGTAGDTAMAQLQRMGVWSQSVQRLGPAAPTAGG